MNVEALVRRLELFASTLPSSLAALTQTEARFKPPSGAWSILEVVRHLVDEEAEDFRARLRFVLDRAAGAWAPIDPVGWATTRRYNESDLAEAVARFVRERRQSVAWLRALPRSIDWSLAYEHPKFGPIRAGDLLGAWAAHDALHLRQIAKRLYELAAADAPAFKVAYAGEWGP